MDWAKLKICQYSLRSYTWRHNEILEIIAEIAEMCREPANKISCIKTNIQFDKEGNVSKNSHRNNRHKPILFEGSTDWRIIADVDRQLTFPTEITSTHQRPDLIWSVNSKKVIAELTIPFETNIDWAHQRKLESTKTYVNCVLRMAGQQTYFLLRLDFEVLFRTQPLHF